MTRPVAPLDAYQPWREMTEAEVRTAIAKAEADTALDLHSSDALDADVDRLTPPEVAASWAEMIGFTVLALALIAVGIWGLW